MTGQGRPSHFHERFDLPLDDAEVKQRFMNRVTNIVFHQFMRTQVSMSDRGDIRRSVANSLGDVYDSDKSYKNYAANDFYRCLQILEALYEALKRLGLETELSHTIDMIMSSNEVDLGIDWQPPIFVRTGARLLDQAVVNEPLRWLSAPQYQTVLEPFQRGLSHYLEDRFADSVTDMYEAVEALARVITDRNRDLSGNRERFISSIGASDYYKQLLKDYITYANQYRHAARNDEPRTPPLEPEVESFIYLTGLFIRLAIRTT